jgi:hypothetical protein
MKYKTTIVLFTISFILFLIELFFHIDLMVFLFSLHGTILDVMLPIFIFTGIGFGADYIQYILRKKEIEKNQLYRETIFGMEHLVRSLQSRFFMITDSEAVQKEFGNDIIQLLKQSSQDIEGILDKLKMLNTANPKAVRNILATCRHCDICGCQKRHCDICGCQKVTIPIAHPHSSGAGHS